jgi:putative peptide zinc metalloprotease protein
MNATAWNIAAEDRPVALRLRADLQRSWLSLAGLEYQVLHDPITGKHLQLRAEEYAILTQLNGKRTLRELRDSFLQRFAPQVLSWGKLTSFLQQAFHQGLLVSDDAQQGTALWERGTALRQQQRWQALLAIFQCRILRWNPQRLLLWLAPGLLPLFSPLAVAVWLIGMIAAAGVAITHREQILVELPAISEWLHLAHWPLLVAALWLAKSWHELGHALACQRFGVRCHEMGVQLLFGIPCLYCETTAAWQLSDKHQRMAIAAAGIYFEGFLASASAIVYHLTLPGLLHDLSLHLMFVCTLGTLLVNLNPLLRFDGYYLLSDGLEIANLEARARAHLQAVVEWIAFGGEARVLSPFEQRIDARLALFGGLMWVYRAALLLGIIWTLRVNLVPQRLAPLADVLTLLLLLSVAMPLILAAYRWREPYTFAEQQTLLLRVGLPALLVSVVILGAFPLPSSVRPLAVLQPARVQALYATEAGQLLTSLPPGTQVQRGECVVQLANEELQREWQRVTSLAKEQALLIEQIQSAVLLDDASATQQLPTARAALQSLNEQREALQTRLNRLRITAPGTGQILSPPLRENDDHAQSLPDWQGTPLKSLNRGAWIETGTEIGKWVPQETGFQAMTLLDQADAVRVQPGQAVAFRLPAMATTWRGEVVEVARIAVEKLPPELRELQPVSRASQPPVLYFARIQLDATSAPVAWGTRGQLRIQVASETLFTKWQRWYRQTIR